MAINGLVTLKIGTGNVELGDFSSIDWANDTYFIKTETVALEQLVYKKHMINATEMGENMQYKRQLWDAFKCKDITSSKIKNTSYKNTDRRKK